MKYIQILTIVILSLLVVGSIQETRRHHHHRFSKRHHSHRAKNQKSDSKQVPKALQLQDHFGYHPLQSPYGPGPATLEPLPQVIHQEIIAPQHVLSQPVVQHVVAPQPVFQHVVAPQPLTVQHVQPVYQHVYEPVQHVQADPVVTHKYEQPFSVSVPNTQVLQQFEVRPAKPLAIVHQDWPYQGSYHYAESKDEQKEKEFIQEQADNLLESTKLNEQSKSQSSSEQVFLRGPAYYDSSAPVAQTAVIAQPAVVSQPAVNLAPSMYSYHAGVIDRPVAVAAPQPVAYSIPASPMVFTPRPISAPVAPVATFASTVVASSMCEITTDPYYNHCQSLSNCGLCAASPYCGWCVNSNQCLPGNQVHCACAASCSNNAWTFSATECGGVIGQMTNVSPEATKLINPEIASAKLKVREVTQIPHTTSVPVVTGHQQQIVPQLNQDAVTGQVYQTNTVQTTPIYGQQLQTTYTEHAQERLVDANNRLPLTAVDEIKNHGYRRRRKLRRNKLRRN